MVIKISGKFEGKLICGLKDRMRDLANFLQSSQKSQNLGFDQILFYLCEVENV